jgi:plastocyanin
MRHIFHILCLATSLAWVACGGEGDSTPAQKPSPIGGTPPPPAMTVDPTAIGTVAGVIGLDGAAPKAAELDLKADAWCKNHYDSPPPEESLVVNDGKIANVFVWISAGLEGYSFEAPDEQVVLDQQGCIFSPRVVGIQLGQKVTMHNGDPVLHNVHSKPELNRQRNIALPTKGSSRDFKFDKAEVMVPVVCDVHPWMRAFIGIVDHPFFAISDAAGTFSLEDIPVGEYTLQFWHEKLGVSEQSIVVTKGETLELNDISMAMP